MIKLVKGMERNSYPSEIEQMFSLRKKVFHDRLGWDVRVKDGWECDQFDDLNPLYVLNLDDVSSGISPATDRVGGLSVCAIRTFLCSAY